MARQCGLRQQATPGGNARVLRTVVAKPAADRSRIAGRHPHGRGVWRHSRAAHAPHLRRDIRSDARAGEAPARSPGPWPILPAHGPVRRPRPLLRFAGNRRSGPDPVPDPAPGRAPRSPRSGKRDRSMERGRRGERDSVRNRLGGARSPDRAAWRVSARADEHFPVARFGGVRYDHRRLLAGIPDKGGYRWTRKRNGSNSS